MKTFSTVRIQAMRSSLKKPRRTNVGKTSDQEPVAETAGWRSGARSTVEAPRSANREQSTQVRRLGNLIVENDSMKAWKPTRAGLMRVRLIPS